MDYSQIRTNFERHGFTTQLFSGQEEVCDYFSRLLKRRTIGFGGSVTLKELNLYEALEPDNAVVWHNRVSALEVRQLANCANIYITSANAVTETGEIVNIDMTGNRVAMTSFGPESCYYIIGRNKITPDLTAAIHRCRNVAAPQNARRLGARTPCAARGDKCYNCNSPGRICRILNIIERPPASMKCEVVFIDQELGL